MNLSEREKSATENYCAGLLGICVGGSKQVQAGTSRESMRMRVQLERKGAAIGKVMWHESVVASSFHLADECRHNMRVIAMGTLWVDFGAPKHVTFFPPSSPAARKDRGERML